MFADDAAFPSVHSSSPSRLQFDWAAQESSNIQKPRVIHQFCLEAAQNPAHSALGKPQLTLGVVIEAWQGLPEPIKAGILAMVRVSGDAGSIVT